MRRTHLPLDQRELTEENFDEAYDALVGQYDKALTSASSYPYVEARWESPLNISPVASGRADCI